VWTARHILLLALLAVAAVTDVRRHRIYNWNTYPGILAGVAINWIERGRDGLEDSLTGFAACGAILLVCFVLFQIGGGDVKLMAMIGAFLGPHQGIEALLWTFVLGSLASLTLLIWQLGFVHIIRKTFEHIRCIIRAGGWVPLTHEEREPLRRTLYLAPAALPAVCIVLGNAQYRWY
jgi:prepilin peptidase CpaA